MNRYLTIIPVLAILSGCAFDGAEEDPTGSVELAGTFGGPGIPVPDALAPKPGDSEVVIRRRCTSPMAGETPRADLARACRSEAVGDCHDMGGVGVGYQIAGSCNPETETCAIRVRLTCLVRGQ